MLSVGKQCSLCRGLSHPLLSNYLALQSAKLLVAGWRAIALAQQRACQTTSDRLCFLSKGKGGRGTYSSNQAVGVLERNQTVRSCAHGHI